MQSDLSLLEDILPPQSPSVHEERLDFNFADRVQISLLVDPRPGCGGIAWPAGEVQRTSLNINHLTSADITAAPPTKVLANYLVSKYTSLSGHHILELGTVHLMHGSAHQYLDRTACQARAPALLVSWLGCSGHPSLLRTRSTWSRDVAVVVCKGECLLRALLETMQRNIELNELTSNVSAMELNW